MAEREIKITFPEPKMQALEFFLKEKNMTVEQVLNQHMDKAYEKTVPQQVRNFVERDTAEQEAEAAQQGARQRQASGDGVQRGRRNSRRMETGRQNHEEETAGQESGSDGTEQAENQETEQEQNGGMSMGM